MTEHDFTNGTWGHNINVLSWDKEKREGRAACWVTPGLRSGDVILVKSEQGSMRMIAKDVSKAPNVDDMYFCTFVPEHETPPEDRGEWVTKVRRNGGGTSIIDIATTKEKAQALADEFNEQYQTDNYYVEPYDEEKHAYSRHG